MGSHPNRHLDRFSRFCSAHDRYRRTDHATPSAAIGRIASAAMRRKNESRVWWPSATFRLETYRVSSCSAGSRVLEDSLLGIKVLTTIYFGGCSAGNSEARGVGVLGRRPPLASHPSGLRGQWRTDSASGPTHNHAAGPSTTN